MLFRKPDFKKKKLNIHSRVAHGPADLCITILYRLESNHRPPSRENRSPIIIDSNDRSNSTTPPEDKPKIPRDIRFEYVESFRNHMHHLPYLLPYNPELVDYWLRRNSIFPPIVPMNHHPGVGGVGTP